MKNYLGKLLMVLTLFIAFGCGETTRDKNEIYFDAKNFMHYDSKTGKPFTGTVKKTGPYPWNKIIENKYVNGKAVQFTWKNKEGTTRAIFKYDENSNVVGELYYSNSGQLVSKSEWEELNQKEGW
jgi:antitoxin component YwqK of YwqJK toxin-antitoxin module